MPSRHARRKELAQEQRTEVLERILPEMLRLAHELHGGQYAPNQAEFLSMSEEMPDRTKLFMAFGKWENAVASCGLTLAEPKYYWQKARERQEAAALQSKVTYSVRNDILLIAEYRPPVKVRKEDKNRAAQLCADIADDKQRRRAWFAALGYSESFVETIL